MPWGHFLTCLAQFVLGGITGLTLATIAIVVAQALRSTGSGR